MKLRYLFGIILSAVLAFTSCQPTSIKESFDNIKLDKSYVAIDVQGGTSVINITATEAWAFQDVDKIPSWLTVSPTSGNAGETKVSFSADAAADGRDVELSILAGSNTQFVKIMQGTKEVSPATCAEVIAGPDGKSYKVKGVCTSIANTQYGNWYLKDATGEIYIYGTLDKKGATKNFSSLGLEVGDEVEVQGPKTTYGTTVELVDVTVLKITKSLVKLDATSKTLDKEGGEFTIKAAYKGNGVLVNIPDETASWVSLLSMDYVKGNVTKIEPNPCDTVLIKFAYLDNMSSVVKRTGSVEIASNNGKSESTVAVALTQNSNEPAKVAIKDCFEQEYTHIYGQVMSVAKDYGFIVSDGTASILIYKSDYTKSARTADNVKVLGAPSLYNWAAQIQNPDLVEKNGYDKSWKLPTAVEYNTEKINGLITKLTGTNKTKNHLLPIEYVTYQGELKIDGNYINVIFPEGCKGQGSLKLSTSLKQEDVAKLDGKQVKVTGYLFQVSASKDVPKFLNVIADKIVEVK
jgi:hypothetical protein